MNIKNNVILLLLIFLLTVPLTGASATVPDPTEQMRPFLDKITKILATEDFKNDRDCTLCQRIIDASRERFDYNEMSKRVLGRTWRDLSPKQQEEFVVLFTDLLQYAYVGKIEDYAGQTVDFKSQRIKGNRAEVKTELVDKDKTIPVSYIMLLKDDQWMVYDVVVEGVSLIRNYMEQFREILRKDKYAGLVKQLEEKIKQLEDERAQRFANKQG